VIPACAQALGYHFQFPDLEAALQDLAPTGDAFTAGWSGKGWNAGG
jgi:hypothetical protein